MFTAEEENRLKAILAIEDLKHQREKILQDYSAAESSLLGQLETLRKNKDDQLAANDWATADMRAGLGGGAK